MKEYTYNITVAINVTPTEHADQPEVGAETAKAVMAALKSQEEMGFTYDETLIQSIQPIEGSTDTELTRMNERS